jgi:hypothetical protein
VTRGAPWENAVNARGLIYGARPGHDWKRTEPPTGRKGKGLRFAGNSDGTPDFRLSIKGPPERVVIVDAKEYCTHTGCLGLARFLTDAQADHMERATVNGAWCGVLLRWAPQRRETRPVVWLMPWVGLRPIVSGYRRERDVRAGMLRAHNLGHVPRPENLPDGVSSLALDQIDSLAIERWETGSTACPDWLRAVPA